MATTDDLTSAATLCANAANAGLNLLIGLGPRPGDAAGGAAWDGQDSLLKNKISTLNNLSSSLSALIVSAALQAVWPTLTDLDKVTNGAQRNVDEIKEITKAMAALASVINFAVSVATLATQPTAGNAGSVATAFKNMVSSLSGQSAAGGAGAAT
jgi:hypothetical protein